MRKFDYKPRIQQEVKAEGEIIEEIIGFRLGVFPVEMRRVDFHFVFAFEEDSRGSA